MAEKISQHKHCQVCAKSIPVSENICSEECKEKYNAIMKRNRLMRLFMYGMLAALVVVLVVYNG